MRKSEEKQEFHLARIQGTDPWYAREKQGGHQVSKSTGKNAPRFEDVRFRAKIVEHANSTFLGYADATLVVPAAISKDADLMLRIRGIQVKILNGTPRIDLPQERGSDGKWYPTIFPKSAETREMLTSALLSDRLVAATVSCVLEDQERAAS